MSGFFWPREGVGVSVLCLEGVGVSVLLRSLLSLEGVGVSVLSVLSVL